MSLLFAADGDLVDMGTSTSLVPTAGSWMGWVYLTSDTDRQGLWQSNGADEHGVHWNAHAAGDPFDAYFTRSTSALLVNANAANFAAYGLNKWVFFSFVWNSAGANSDQKFFMGDLATPCAEPSAYNTQLVGSGTSGTSITSCYIGNQGLTSRELKGRCAWNAMWNRALTREEHIVQQYRPHVTSGCVAFYHIGANGTGTQADWSGNGNNATVTGCSVDVDVPLGPWYGGWSGWRGNYTAAASGRIFALVGDGGGLTGPLRGLVA